MSLPITHPIFGCAHILDSGPCCGKDATHAHGWVAYCDEHEKFHRSGTAATTTSCVVDDDCIPGVKCEGCEE
jgi:hypothetical protein